MEKKLQITLTAARVNAGYSLDEVAKEMKKTKKETISEEKYTKSQIVNSKIYISNRDLLNAVLRENKKYTKIEIDEIIKNYMKGKVN